MATTQRRERRHVPLVGTSVHEEVEGVRDATTPEARMRQAVARCLSMMVFYHHDHADRRDTSPMRGEIRQIAAWIAELGLGHVALDVNLIEPVRVGLVERFGHEVGARLFEEFTSAFDADSSEAAADSPRA